MNEQSPITFVDAVAAGFRNWRNTAGTASRREFWFWFLFTALVSMVVATVDSIVFPVSDVEIPEDVNTITSEQIRNVLDITLSDTLWSLSTLAAVLLFVPTLSVTVRRFRDAGVSPNLGWAVQLLNPVSTAAIFILAYQIADGYDRISSDDSLAVLGGQVLAMFAIALVNLVAFVLWIVVAARPTSPTGSR